MASFHCPFQPVYPQIDFTDLNEGYPFSFATTDLPSEQADVYVLCTVSASHRPHTPMRAVLALTERLPAA